MFKWTWGDKTTRTILLSPTNALLISEKKRPISCLFKSDRSNLPRKRRPLNYVTATQNDESHTTCNHYQTQKHNSTVCGDRGPIRDQTHTVISVVWIDRFASNRSHIMIILFTAAQKARGCNGTHSLGPDIMNRCCSLFSIFSLWPRFRVPNSWHGSFSRIECATFNPRGERVEEWDEFIDSIFVCLVGSWGLHFRPGNYFFTRLNEPFISSFEITPSFQPGATSARLFLCGVGEKVNQIHFMPSHKRLGGPVASWFFSSFKCWFARQEIRVAPQSSSSPLLPSY